MIDWKKLLRVFSKKHTDRGQPISKPAPTVSVEDIRKFLPTFLSQGSETAFVDEMADFLRRAENHPHYTDALRDEPFIFQGDGIEGLLIINLPDTTTREGAGIVISNSCDVNPLNQRLFEASLCYAPILSLPAYLDTLRKRYSEERVASHERDLRRQSITQIFFLPKGGKLANDALVFLDHIISMPNQTIDTSELSERRLFTLSDFGAWLFTLKLSIHFCRIHDKVDRVAGVVA